MKYYTFPDNRRVLSVAYSPDGNSIATGSNKGARIWNWHKKPTLEQIAFKKVLSFWWQVKKQKKSINSIDELFESVLTEFSIDRNTSKNKCGITKEALQSVYDTFPKPMQGAIWETVKKRIGMYGV